MNKPREGNVPGQHPAHSENDGFDTKHPLERKIESGLAEPVRGTLRHYDMAMRNGWTMTEFYHWVDTGETPGGLPASEPLTPDKPDEDRSERIGRKPK